MRILGALTVVASVACGGDTPPADTMIRTIAGFGSATTCRVEIPGYYYIASPLPYSGAWPVGGQVEEGVVQAVQEVNDAGGIKGLRLGLVICDTLSEPGNATNIMTELARIPEISATTCCMRSAETVPASEIARMQQLVMLSPGATSTTITDLVDDGYTNRVVPPDSIQGAIAARVAYSNGHRSVFVATLNDPYGTSLADIFIAEFESLGGTATQVIYTESGAVHSPPLAEVISMARDADPDLVYVAGLARDAGGLVNTAASTSYVVPWMLPDGVRTMDFINAVSDRAYLDNVSGTAPAPPSEAFAARFNATWGRNPEVFVASAYDAIYLLSIAMELSEDPEDRVAVRDHLLADTQVGTSVDVETARWGGILTELAGATSIDYFGASGPVDLDENGDVRANVELWRIQAGEFMTTGCRTPDNMPCP